jgi:hypothetical protein
MASLSWLSPIYLFFSPSTSGVVQSNAFQPLHGRRQLDFSILLRYVGRISLLGWAAFQRRVKERPGPQVAMLQLLVFRCHLGLVSSGVNMASCSAQFIQLLHIVLLVRSNRGWDAVFGTTLVFSPRHMPSEIHVPQARLCEKFVRHVSDRHYFTRRQPRALSSLGTATGPWFVLPVTKRLITMRRLQHTTHAACKRDSQNQRDETRSTCEAK